MIWPRWELACGCVFDGPTCIVECAPCRDARSAAGYTKADRIHLRREEVDPFPHVSSYVGSRPCGCRIEEGVVIFGCDEHASVGGAARLVAGEIETQAPRSAALLRAFAFGADCASVGRALDLHAARIRWQKA